MDGVVALRHLPCSPGESPQRLVNHSLNSHAADIEKAKMRAAASGRTVLSTLPASATCIRLVVTSTV